MFVLSKRVITSFIRGECERRLRLDLYGKDKDRIRGEMPGKAVDRPGFILIAEQGRDHERAKFAEMARAFPGRIVHGAMLPGKRNAETGEAGDSVYEPLPLSDCIDGLRAVEGGHAFLVEAEYTVEAPFVSAHSINDLKEGVAFRPAARGRPAPSTQGRVLATRPTLGFARVRPDIVHASAPTGVARKAIAPDGTVHDVPADDARVGLRIVDIKLSSEPSPAHFAELAYYGMTLAGWLVHTGRDRAFVVLKDAAIWPGKHEGSRLHALELDDERRGETSPFDRQLEAFESDLETMPAEVVLGRVRRFLSRDLRKAILTPDWTALPWHVDSGCIGCDYLGYDWKRTTEEPDAAGDAAEGPGDGRREPAPDGQNRHLMCWPTAEREGHLSRVAGLSRGACGRLKAADVPDIARLAGLKPSSRVFDEHHKLAAGRTLFHSRSAALAGSVPAGIADRTGTSAVIPRFTDVDVALSVDYDVGSGISFAIGYQVLARHPTLDEASGEVRTRVHRREPRVMLVEQRRLASESRVLKEIMGFLVRDLLEEADAIEAAHAGLRTRRGGKKATFQVFVWDRLVLEHLREVTGRHVDVLLSPPSEDSVSAAPMAWLFPSVFVLEDDRFAGANSPVSVVSDAVGAMLAADVPHHYSLLGVANAYHPAFNDGKDGKPSFRVGGLFHDPLSDQIPSERGHEVWSNVSPVRSGHWQDHRERMRRTVATKLRALHAVVERLRADLGDTLKSRAPAIRTSLAPPRPLGAVAPDARVWYRHARLMGAVDRLDNDLLLAMPPHQREATFESLRLGARLKGAEAGEALRALGKGELDGRDTTFVFRVERRSCQAKVKDGQGNWSLMPQSALGLADRTVESVKADHPELGAPGRDDARKTIRGQCEVEVARFDGSLGLIALKSKTRLLRDLEAVGVLDFDVDGSKGVYAVMDPLPMDVFTARFRRVAEAMGAPPMSLRQPLFRGRDIVLAKAAGVRPSKPIPSERFLWQADLLAKEDAHPRARAVLDVADPGGSMLTPRQAKAVLQGAGSRLTLMWGPPGTGKTHTSVRLIIGLVAEAVRRGEGLRIAVTGPTWVAVDTVVRKLPKLLRDHGLTDEVQLARLVPSSGARNVPDELVPHLVEGSGKRWADLRQRLADRLPTIVAGTVYRLNDLASERDGDGITLLPSFDYMLVDEASQMQVTQAVVALSGLAEGACVTVVGDDLQMPPIQAVPPPDGKEHLLGSIYDFYKHYRKGELTNAGIRPVMLDRSFRSNAEIVGFVRRAGYGEDLQAAHAGLRMRLAAPVPTARPDGWGEAIPFSPALAAILDPESPLVAVIHEDDASSQRSDAEASLVAAVARLLQGRLLDGEGVPLADADLFKHGLGVVTPHRAQQAAVIERLRPLLSGEDALRAMQSAVDTVERFQGQERTVMLASFGVGDRDQVAAEEEFIYSLNRFNVIASRAQAKMIVIVSRRIVDHLPSDPKALQQSHLLKSFAQAGRRRSVRLDFPGLDDCEIVFPG